MSQSSVLPLPVRTLRVGLIQALDGIRMTRALSIILCLALASCARGPGTSTDASASPSVSFELTPSQMKAMEAKARAGNVEAMLTIAAHFDFGVSEPDKAIPCLELAVARGDVSAMRGLAIHLSTSRVALDCRRAEELFLRAIKESRSAKTRTKNAASLEHLRRGLGAGHCGPYFHARKSAASV